ncbi:hypothetical protein PCE1_002316 [Barthelona sp. PCE]
MIDKRTFVNQSTWNFYSLMLGIPTLIFLVVGLYFLNSIAGHWMHLKAYFKKKKTPLWLSILILSCIPIAVILEIILGVLVITNVQPIQHGWLTLFLLIAFTFIAIGCIIWLGKKGFFAMSVKVCITIGFLAIYALMIVVSLTTDPYSFMTLSFTFFTLNLVFVSLTFYFAAPSGRLNVKNLVTNNDAPIINRTNVGASVTCYLLSILVLIVYSLMHSAKDSSSNGLGWVTSGTVIFCDVIVYLYPSKTGMQNPSIYFVLFAAIRALIVGCGYNYWFVGHSGLFFLFSVFVGIKIISSNLNQSSAGQAQIALLQKKDAIPAVIKLGVFNLPVFLYFLSFFVFIVDIFIAYSKPSFAQIPSIKAIDSTHEQFEFGIGAIVASVLTVLFYVVLKYLYSLSFDRDKELPKARKENFIILSIISGIAFVLSAVGLFILTKSSFMLLSVMFVPIMIAVGAMAFLLLRRNDFEFVNQQYAFVRRNTSLLIFCGITYFVCQLLYTILSLIVLKETFYWSSSLFLPTAVLCFSFFITWYFVALAKPFWIYIVLAFGFGSLAGLYFLTSGSIGKGFAVLWPIIVFIHSQRRLYKEEGLTGGMRIRLFIIVALIIIGSVIGSIVVYDDVLRMIATPLGVCILLIAVGIVAFYFSHDRFLYPWMRTLGTGCLAALVVLGLLVGAQGEGIFWGVSISLSVLFFASLVLGVSAFPFSSTDIYKYVFSPSSVFPALVYDSNTKSMSRNTKSIGLLFVSLVLSMGWGLFTSVWIKPVQLGMGVVYVSMSLMLSAACHLILAPSIHISKVASVINRDIIAKAANMSEAKAFSGTVTKSIVAGMSASENSDVVLEMPNDVLKFDADHVNVQAMDWDTLVEHYNQFYKELMYKGGVYVGVFLESFNKQLEDLDNMREFLSIHFKREVSPEEIAKYSQHELDELRTKFEEYMSTLRQEELEELEARRLAEEHERRKLEMIQHQENIRRQQEQVNNTQLQLEEQSRRRQEELEAERLRIQAEISEMKRKAQQEAEDVRRKANQEAEEELRRIREEEESKRLIREQEQERKRLQKEEELRRERQRLDEEKRLLEKQRAEKQRNMDQAKVELAARVDIMVKEYGNLLTDLSDLKRQAGDYHTQYEHKSANIKNECDESIRVLSKYSREHNVNWSDAKSEYNRLVTDISGAIRVFDQIQSAGAQLPTTSAVDQMLDCIIDEISISSSTEITDSFVQQHLGTGVNSIGNAENEIKAVDSVIRDQVDVLTTYINQFTKVSARLAELVLKVNESIRRKANIEVQRSENEAEMRDEAIAEVISTGNNFATLYADLHDRVGDLILQIKEAKVVHSKKADMIANKLDLQISLYDVPENLYMHKFDEVMNRCKDISQAAFALSASLMDLQLLQHTCDDYANGIDESAPLRTCPVGSIEGVKASIIANVKNDYECSLAEIDTIEAGFRSELSVIESSLKDTQDISEEVKNFVMNYIPEEEEEEVDITGGPKSEDFSLYNIPRPLSKRQFTDDRFPHNKQCLGNYKSMSSVGSFDRLSNKGYTKTFDTPVEELPYSVKQGYLGDCYYLASLSCLALYPKLLRRVFIEADPETGYYKVRFWKNGEETIVEVDDYVPLYDWGGVLFGRSTNEKETWVSVLEKAYAKLHCSYANIASGFVCFAVADLTGGIGQILSFKDFKSEISSGKFWKRLVNYQEANFILGAGSLSGSDTNSKDGIVKGHAYSILQVRELHYDGRQHKLLQMRNPHAKTEPESLPFSDGDSSVWTKKLKNSLGHNLCNDGLFWIQYSDFLKYFRNLYVTMFVDQTVFDKPGFKRTSINGAWRGKYAGGCCNHSTWKNNAQWRLTLREPSDVWVLLRQEDERMTGKKHTAIGVSVYKRRKNFQGSLTSASGEFADSGLVYSREVLCETSINPNDGTFIIVPTTYDKGVSRKFNLIVITRCEHELERLN